MSEIQITLSEAERDLLSRMLETALSDKRVEVRRTEFSSKMHDELRGEEELIRQLREKLGGSA